DALRPVGQRPADRRLPARGRDRPPARPARRPAVAQAPARRCRPDPAERLRPARLQRLGGADRRARLRRRPRHRLRPAVYAGLPNLVHGDDLPRANALLRLAEQLTIMVGTLAGGIVVAAAGEDTAYAVNAVSFGLSAALLLRIPGALLQQGLLASRGYWHDLRDGFHVVIRSRPLLAVLLSWNLAMITIAFVNVSEVFLARDSFDAGNFGFGLLFASNGLGAVIGALFAPGLVERRGMTFL